MVFKLQRRLRPRVSFLIRAALTAALVSALGASWAPSRACAASGAENLKAARSFFNGGQYFKAARYAFSAAETGGVSNADVYALITSSLLKAGLHNASAYFFIRTLQTRDPSAIRRVLAHTQELMLVVGADLLKPYLVSRTRPEDYNDLNRSAFLFALGKSELLKGHEAKALGHLAAVSKRSPLYPYALELRGTSEAIRGQGFDALRSFDDCIEFAGGRVEKLSDQDSNVSSDWASQESKLLDDLKNRCIASKARTLYQLNRFDEAERVYDQIPKSSLVWTDILFEQAWNAFAKTEYNRSLGKLVTYKSPALKFSYNSEVDVLRAQSFLALCLYSDANNVINEFNKKYARAGEDVKRFVESRSSSLETFYDEGKRALQGPLYTDNEFHRMMNRFVRSPYFQKLVFTESAVRSELNAVRRFSQMSGGDSSGGFPGFLRVVLGWRARMARQLGGAFVKNSLIDYHTVLIGDFEKMSFIKLEMLKRAKEKLVSTKPSTGRERGVKEPSRRDDQYKWSFNGEFWNDELGDYVFALESECGK